MDTNYLNGKLNHFNIITTGKPWHYGQKVFQSIENIILIDIILIDKFKIKCLLAGIHFLRACVLKALIVRCQSIPSIDLWSTLNWHLNRHSDNIPNNVRLVNSWLTFDQYLNWQMINTWSTISLPSVNNLIGINQRLVDSELTVDSVSTKVLMECPSRASIKGIDWHSTMDAFSTHNRISLWKLSSFE